LSTGAGEMEPREVFGLEEGGAFQRNRTANVDVGGLDLLPGEAERRQHLEREVVELLVGEAEILLHPVGAERPLVEDELDVES